jgi:hypothetical protein
MKRKRIGNRDLAFLEDTIGNMTGIIKRMELLAEHTDDLILLEIIDETHERAVKTRNRNIAQMNRLKNHRQ